MHFYISEHYQCLLRRALTKYITEITYNIDRMCIRHHTHWSVESVAERGAAAPFTVLSVVKRSSGCRNPNSVCLPRASRIRGHRSRWSEAHCSVYNI